jgi:hypothetical protein
MDWSLTVDYTFFYTVLILWEFIFLERDWHDSQLIIIKSQIRKIWRTCICISLTMPSIAGTKLNSSSMMDYKTAIKVINVLLHPFLLILGRISERNSVRLCRFRLSSSLLKLCWLSSLVWDTTWTSPTKLNSFLLK